MVSVPVPFRGLKQVNLWLLEDSDGFTMVDCGWGDDATRLLLDAAWAKLPCGKPVTRLILTHFHPDHAGNCKFICERWGLIPMMTQTEWMAANLALVSLYSDDFDFRAIFYAQNGLSEDLLELYRTETILYHSGVALTKNYRRVRPGETFAIGRRVWSVLTGQGHSPDQILLYCAADDILIAGDQLLPEITPNISVWPWEPEGDPLEEYLAGLTLIGEAVGPQTLVLPSHRAPFRNASARIAELKAHHTERLQQVLDLVVEKGQCTAADLFAPLFKRKLDGHQINFAMGETLAHLNRLVNAGEIRQQTDANGITQFSQQ